MKRLQEQLQLLHQQIKIKKPVRSSPVSSSQGGRFMSTAMYDAREALIPGSVYDRSANGNHRHSRLPPPPQRLRYANTAIIPF